MNKELLSRVLQEAVAVFSSAEASIRRLPILLHEANERSEKADPRLVALLDTLKEEPELKIFDGMMQAMPSGSTRVEYQTLARWLIERTDSVYPDQAVEDLETYVKANELPLQFNAGIAGLTPDRSYEIGHGILFVPWDSVQDSSGKHLVWERGLQAVPFNMPTGALIRNSNIAKLHVSVEELDRCRIPPLDDSGFNDALLCMTVAGPFASHILAFWVSGPPWAPIVSGGISLPWLDGFIPAKPFSENAGRLARELFETFCGLPATSQKRLRLAMQRLNRAMGRLVPVDASIDLGIALEALYLNDMSDDRGELTFRLRTRAARFLGATEAHRKQIFTLVGDLYGMRSSAVHTGAVSETIRGKQAQKVLDEGFSIAADTVRRFIADGEPNWDSVMFS